MEVRDAEGSAAAKKNVAKGRVSDPLRLVITGTIIILRAHSFMSG